MPIYTSVVKPQRSQRAGTESGLQLGDVKLKVSVLIEELVQLTEDSIDACSNKYNIWPYIRFSVWKGLLGTVLTAESD